MGANISSELPLWWNYIRGVQTFGYVGQLIPFCLGVGGLVKVIWAFFDQNSAHGRRLKNCKCKDQDEDLDSLAQLWKEVQEYERRVKGQPEIKEEEWECRKFESAGWTYWFRVSTLRFKS